MYRTPLLLVAISVSVVCQGDTTETKRDGERTSHQPARAEKRHYPAFAEKSNEWWARFPPEKVIPLFAPELVKDMRERIPLRTGMTSEEVSKAMTNRHDWPYPLRHDTYYLAGGKDGKNTFFAVIDGRMEGFLLIFFKEDRVESIWCQLGRVQLSLGPAFVLWGDPKPRDEVKKLFVTEPYQYLVIEPPSRPRRD